MAVHDANEQRVVDAGGTTALALLASTDEPLLDAALEHRQPSRPPRDAGDLRRRGGRAAAALPMETAAKCCISRLGGYRVARR